MTKNRTTTIYKTKTTEEGNTITGDGRRASIGKRNMNPSRSRRGYYWWW